MQWPSPDRLVMGDRARREMAFDGTPCQEMIPVGKFD